MKLVPIVALVSGLVFGASVQAATIVVKKGGAIATIQAGINAAAPGDVVLVFPGTYTETPTILSSKTGLVVRGKGKVIVDARDPDGSADGACFTVQAAGVTLERMTIRHAAFEVTDGHGVLATADGLTLRRLVFTSMSQYAVKLTGADLTMIQCTAKQCFGGAQITGNGARVESCTFTNLEDRALDTDGAQIVVRKNVVRDCVAGGIRAVNATSAQLVSNVVERVGGIGIEASGTSLNLVKNKVVGADVGLDVTGTSAVVEGNSVKETQGRAIDVSGLSAYVRKNRVERVTGQGIFVFGDSASFLSNVALRCGDFGIGVSGNSAYFGKNVALDCCVAGEGAGISVLGSSCSLEKNVARRCADGIRINGASAYLGQNVATNNALDGFEVAGGVSISLEKNVAIGNGAEGIDNAGTSTSLIGNVCKGNRIDIASQLALSGFDGNVFTTGGPNQLPEVD